jgi:hypothetical protein
MARRSSRLDALVERFAQVLVDRIGASIPRGTPRDGTAPGRGGERGRKRDMRCRYAGCKNRSKGPRFRFLCEKHMKLPKKKQDEVLAKWAAKNAKRE